MHMRFDGKELPDGIKKAVFAAVAVIAVLVVLFLTWLLFLKRAKVDAGFQGVLIDKPYFFGKGGVRQDTVSTGAKWMWVTTEMVAIDTRPLQSTEGFNDMITSDNIPVDFNAYVKFVITEPVTLVAKYGANQFYPNNLKEPFRTIVRNNCRKYKMTELISDAATIQKMEGDIQNELIAYVAENKYPVKIMDVIIGKAQPNDDVMTAINQTAAQQQLQKTEKERAKAQEHRKEAEQRRAEADNAYRMSMNLSPEQFVSLEAIKAYKEVGDACAKGKDCTLVIVPNNTNMVLPKK